MQTALYIPKLPWEIRLTIALPGVLMAGFSVLSVVWVGHYGAAVLAFIVSALCGYWYFGLARSVRVMKSDTAFFILRREVLEPFARQTETEISFEDIVEVRSEGGPRSHHGPEVSGERIAVVTTRSDELRVSSRWMAPLAFTEFYNDARDAAAANDHLNGSYRFEQSS